MRYTYQLNSLIFRKNFLQLKRIFTILILKTFLWNIAMNSLFENGGESYLSLCIPDLRGGNNIDKIDQCQIHSYTSVFDMIEEFREMK